MHGKWGFYFWKNDRGRRKGLGNEYRGSLKGSLCIGKEKKNFKKTGGVKTLRDGEVFRWRDLEKMWRGKTEWRGLKKEKTEKTMGEMRERKERCEEP